MITAAFRQKQTTMLFKNFIVQLSWLTLLLIILLLVLHQLPVFQEHQLFSWISLLSFVGFCLLSFFLQSKSVEHSNKSLFGNVFLLSIFFKLLLCAFLVIAYAIFAKPSSVYFILPFFIIYIFYTVFEVYFILKLAKS